MKRGSRALVTMVLVGAATGCLHAARVFLDLPEGLEAPRRAASEDAVSAEMLDSVFRALMAGPELPPPPIESVSDSDSVLALLPSRRDGAVDWVKAVKDGTIRPRPARPNASQDAPQVFPFDFYLQESEGPEAFFPHSVHQDWLSCQSCHPGVYRRRHSQTFAEEVHDSGSCDLCHDGLAFPIAACERCHVDVVDLPPARLGKSLGATIQMSRVESPPAENNDGNYIDVGQSSYPPAFFPHGAHRVRFQCRACHEQPYPMASGASVLTRREAHGPDGCGYCHDGTNAFDAGLDACYRCHEERAFGSLP